MAGPNFWDDQEAAHKTIEACNALKMWTIPYHELRSRFDDIKELLPEAESVGDGELIQELVHALGDVEKKLGDLEIRKMLSGELDAKDCYLEINAGAGGTESCDWAAMLSRMYQRWATKRGWKVDIIDPARRRGRWDQEHDVPVHCSLRVWIQQIGKRGSSPRPDFSV